MATEADDSITDWIGDLTQGDSSGAQAAPGGVRWAMSHRPGLPEPLSPEIRRLVVAARERFEGAWRRGGDRPAIEPYLDGLGPVERAAVLHELAALEIALRAGEGDHPTLEATTDRFPDDAQDVTAAFAPSNGATAAHTSAQGISSGPSTEPLATAPGVAETTPRWAARGGGREFVPRRLGRYQARASAGSGELRQRLPRPRRRAGPRRGHQGADGPVAGAAGSTRGVAGRGPPGGRPEAPGDRRRP